MFTAWQRWRRAKVRALGRHNYVRFTPDFGFAVSLAGGRRVRFAWHHGLQLVRWHRNRWIVERQLLGKSTVKGERYAAVRAP